MTARAVSVVAAAALLGCGGHEARRVDTAKGTAATTARGGGVAPPAPPAPPAPRADSAAIAPPSVDAEALAADTSQDARAADSGAADSGAAWASDSAVRLASVLLPRRSFRDKFSFRAAVRAGLKHNEWPVRGPAPLAGAVLPHRRIVAFYGNPLSKKMGILGEIPPDQMLAKLDQVVAQWRAADPSIPVQPALHLIAVVAQGTPGKDNLYRYRVDTALIEKVYAWARQKQGVLFLDIQAGLSTIEAELPRLLPYLARADVHLAVDPEFYMHYNREGRHPGEKIGTMGPREVNYAIEQLASLVAQYKLPPKVLVVHRFTRNMLQHPQQIRLDPRVQVVIDMDGWGQPWLKFDTYKTCEVDEPVQYTGFKLFFHNDTKKGDPLLTPREVLALRPRPLYIQYQ